MRFYLFVLIVGLSHDKSEASECTSRGRFPNNDEPDCRGYTMCLIGGSANFTQYKLTCPLGSVYSHLEQVCTSASAYSCFPSYNCSITGNFEDPSSKNCSSFVSCVNGLAGIVTARRIECPIYQVFSPEKGICVKEVEYECSAETTVALTEVPSTESIGFQLTSETPLNNASGVSTNLFVVVLLCWLNKCI